MWTLFTSTCFFVIVTDVCLYLRSTSNIHLENESISEMDNPQGGCTTHSN